MFRSKYNAFVPVIFRRATVTVTVTVTLYSGSDVHILTCLRKFWFSILHFYPDSEINQPLFGLLQFFSFYWEPLFSEEMYYLYIFNIFRTGLYSLYSFFPQRSALFRLMCISSVQSCLIAPYLKIEQLLSEM